MGEPSAPALSESANYPLLTELLEQTPRDVPSVADTDDGTERARIIARNQDCPFCEKPVTSNTVPTVLLACGHAYHAMCGRSYLFRKTGTECTMGACHRTTKRVESDRLKEIIERAIDDGEFTRADLNDPIMRRDIMLKVGEKMNAAHRDLDIALPATREDNHSVEAYRTAWKQTRVGCTGFGFAVKGRLLYPYTRNPLVIRKSNVTMATLLDRESEYRRSMTDDGDDGRAPVDVTSTQSARISVPRFVAAGLTISDIFFGLELTSWPTLCEFGFAKEHITDGKGAFPVTALADLYGVDYEAFVRDLRWSVSDISRVHISARELASIGATFDKMYLNMGLDKARMMTLRYSPKEWHDVLGLDKRYIATPLGIHADDFHLLAWSSEEVTSAFNIKPLEREIIQDTPIASITQACSMRSTCDSPVRVDIDPNQQVVSLIPRPSSRRA